MFAVIFYAIYGSYSQKNINYMHCKLYVYMSIF
jgi:hypothetical protein